MKDSGTAMRGEFGPMMRLAVPLVLAEIGWMAMGVVDTLMVGRLPDSAVAIGAVSLGSVVFYSISVAGGALMMGLDTLVSQAFGAKRYEECHRSLWSAMALLVPLVPLLMAAVWLVSGAFPGFGVNPAMAPAAARYTRILTAGMPGLFLYFAMRRYLQGMAHVRVVTFALLSANLVNLAGNWALIYGRMGLPALGTDGSAWATCIARYYMAGVLAAYTLYIEHRDQHGIFAVGMRPDPARMRRLLALGGPAALHVGFEYAIFALATMLAARLAPEDLAAHQIALNLSSLTFMIPLGLSSAAAVRVGHRIGAGDPAGAGRSGHVAILLGAVFMSAAAIVFLVAPEPLARAYTSDVRVIATSVTLLAVAAVFQLFDGLQIVSAGALRGAGDTRTPMIANLVFYWMVGLPVCYVFGIRAGWGVAGIWAGLCLGLVLIGSTLLVVWRRKAAALMRQIHAATDGEVQRRPD